MLKRRPIDTYIRRATAGLPRLERVDTAAEIRVHLLQKTRELMAQGFPREEAEHLAVQEMGPVAATNRAFLGHAFTSRLGWIVVGITVIASGIWISQRQPANATLTIERVTEKLVSDDGPNFSGLYQDYKLILPPGTERITTSVDGVNGGQRGAAILFLDQKKTTPTEIKLRVGVYAGPMTNCPSGYFSSFKLLNPTPEQSGIGMTNSIPTCIRTNKPLSLPGDRVYHLMPSTPEEPKTKPEFNRWIPLLQFENPQRSGNGMYLGNTPSNWMSIMVQNGSSQMPVEVSSFVRLIGKFGERKLEAVRSEFVSEWAKRTDTKILSIREDHVLLDEMIDVYRMEGEPSVFDIQTTPNIKLGLIHFC